jgi:hypothetical protein
MSTLCTTRSPDAGDVVPGQREREIAVLKLAPSIGEARGESGAIVHAPQVPSASATWLE